MRDYFPEQFKNSDLSLIEIESLIKLVDKNLLMIGTDYVNKITGKIENDRFFKIRSSLELRIQSIVFHYRILNSIHNPSKKLIFNEHRPLGVELIPLQQKFLFDSIVFNSISAFDYLASLINLIIIKNKDRWEKTWAELERTARMDALFNKTKLGLMIRSTNNDWVRNLNEYRSELIHYQTENLGFQSSMNVIFGTIKVIVHAPPKMKTKFRQLKEIRVKEDYNINSISLWLIKTCLEVILEVQDVITEYIEEHRIIPEEKAIYTFVKNNPK